MLPLYLRLRNFMSYGQDGAELDLRPIQLACLSGPNGHGKSTLVDAITWALWGESRAPREDDLFRQGTTDMEVELHFLAGHTVYRVIRRRVWRKSGGAAMLELAVLEAGQFRAITGGTIAETEQSIIELLHLSYETFINSSLLLQGRADSFTMKRPSERKEVLAEILGLGAYETLAERARERARSLSRDAEILSERIETLERWAAPLPSLEVALRDKDGAVRTLQASIEAQRCTVDTLSQRLHALQGLQESVTRAERRLGDIASEEGTALRHRTAAQRRLAEVEQLLAQEPALRQQVAALEAARLKNDHYTELLTALRELDTEEAALRQTIGTEESHLKSEMASLEKEVALLLQQTQPLPVRREELVQVREQLETLPSLQAERLALQQRDHDLVEAAAHAQAARSTLDQRRNELRRKLETLNGASALCPVCNTPLDPAHRDQLRQEVRQEGMTCKQAILEHDQALAAITQERAHIQQQSQQLERRIAQVQQQSTRAGALEQQVQDLEARLALLPERREAIARCQAVLERADFALEARHQLQGVAARRAALGYDAEAHRHLRVQIEQLRPAQEAFAQLELTRESRREACTQLESATVLLQALTQERARLQAELVPMREAVVALPAVQAEHAETVCALGALQEQLGQLQEERGRLANQIALAREREVERQTAQRERAELLRQAWAHKELSVIFGKTGIQAMLIENALPELEADANDLLSRMTDNSTQVGFVTRRSGKSGAAIETLDIRIADNLGTRTYEMFSGGEAFRINLAIRIALSKLLTRRAGADLSFLLIDEGFGSQDSLGRDRLVEAISAIAEDFQKILVVTHIDELKDQFDVRIEVSKGPGGSQISVSAS